LLFAAALVALAVLGAWLLWSPGRGCTAGPGGISVCALSEHARVTARGAVASDDPDLNLKRGAMLLHAARNEVVAFQLVFQGSSFKPRETRVRVTDLVGPGGQRLPADPYVSLFLASYVEVDPGGYTWGPPSEVLPWPDAYPDALIPFKAPCDADAPPLVESFPVPGPEGRNQTVWVDLYVPPRAAPGRYHGHVELEVDGERQRLPLELEVWGATLPDEPRFDAVGELYDAYRDEGAGLDLWSKPWRDMAHCYQRLAHQHRMVFIERLGALPGPSLTNPEPDPGAWDDHDAAFGPALDGSLFSARSGYVGPGADTPVTVWRAPWPQLWNGRVDEVLGEEVFARHEALARHFGQHAADERWGERTRFFAYLFDEVDGPTDIGADDQGVHGDDAYLQKVHGEMARMQRALDAGSPSIPIDLLWTSHADAAQWRGDPALDLTGTIRWWCPTASAAQPSFLRERKAAGERVWFYHSGHPAVGVHSVNATGGELRSWGLALARYNLDGTFMWAVNLGDPEDPFRYPSYKRQDDRFGNGTLVYPGAKLDRIGLRPSPGPIPSMRLKAWRRGLQDAELAESARELGYRTQTDWLLERAMPAALGEAPKDGDKLGWPQSAAQWRALRLDLLKLASP
jgi:hypothetical protein